MTETPEQRRERIEEALWNALQVESCSETCWGNSPSIPAGCTCLARLVEAFLVIDKENTNGNG